MTTKKAIEMLEAVIECLRDARTSDHANCVDELRDVASWLEERE